MWPASTFITYFHMKISWNISSWSLQDIVTVPGMVETLRLSFKRKKKERKPDGAQKSSQLPRNWGRSVIGCYKDSLEGRGCEQIQEALNRSIEHWQQQCVCLRSKHHHQQQKKPNRSVQRKIRKRKLGGWDGLPATCLLLLTLGREMA